MEKFQKFVFNFFHKHFFQIYIKITQPKTQRIEKYELTSSPSDG